LSSGLSARRESGYDSQFLVSPGGHHDQDATAAGFPDNDVSRFTTVKLRFNIYGTVEQNLLRFFWSYTVLGNVVSICLIPIELNSHPDDSLISKNKSRPRSLHMPGRGSTQITAHAERTLSRPK
jgi:hypothetical protein